VEVAHCDHRWRSDSGEAARQVARLCFTWGLPFHLAVAEVPPAGEAAAREWRYRRLTEFALARGCSRVLTGHTASDRAETLLFNLVRGSGGDGLASLDWCRPLVEGVQLVRPLLALFREETEKYCFEKCLPVAIDESNLKPHFSRNRIRLELLPYLRTHFNPQVEAALARTAALLADESAFLEAEANRYRESLVAEGRLDRRGVARLPLALQRRVVRGWLIEALGAQPNFAAVERVLACLTAPNRTRTSPVLFDRLVEVQGEWLALVQAGRRRSE